MKTTARTLMSDLSFAALFMICISNAQATSIEVGATTAGSFVSPSGPWLNHATLGTFLTFIGSSFNVTTDPSGYALLTDLGTFTRSKGEGGNDDNKEGHFWLNLTFTNPSGVLDAQFSAIARTDVGGPGAPFGIDFDEAPFQFTFNDKLYNLFINDIPSIHKNQSVQITGYITDPPPEVPESTSLLLLGTGLGVICLTAWRKRI